MGFLDEAKKKLTDAVDKHGDKIGDGLDRAGGMIDKRTGGKHSAKISAGVDRAKTSLDGLDGRRDDIPSTRASHSEPGGDPGEGDQPTGPTGPDDPSKPTDPSEPAAPTGPMGSGVPGGGGHRPETDPDAAGGAGSDAGPGERP
jgi:hypothetical protein